MKRLLFYVLLLMTTGSKAQDLKLNDLEYFERQGVNVLVFSNSFNGGFNENGSGWCGEAPLPAIPSISSSAQPLRMW